MWGVPSDHYEKASFSFLRLDLYPYNGTHLDSYPSREPWKGGIYF